MYISRPYEEGVHKVTRAFFEENYFGGTRPVQFTGLDEKMPAYTRWHFEFFKEKGKFILCHVNDDLSEPAKITRRILISEYISLLKKRRKLPLYDRVDLSKYKQGDILDFIPNEDDSATWGNKINLYPQDNKSIYQPIMNRLCREMEIQNEVFAPVLGTFSHDQIKMTLLAIKSLCESDDCLDFALRNMIGRIIIVDCEELVGCSSPLFLGIIIIAPKKNWTIYDYMENIIHEMSHIELYIKQIVDPLIIKGSYLKSPFRNQLRPASGVYHAAFVLARIIKYIEPFSPKSQHAAGLKNQMGGLRILLDETLSQFHDRRILTPAGQKFLMG